MLLATRRGVPDRNVSDCWMKVRASDVQPQRAQRTPSVWAARECEQIGQSLLDVLMVMCILKINACFR